MVDSYSLPPVNSQQEPRFVKKMISEILSIRHEKIKAIWEHAKSEDSGCLVEIDAKEELFAYIDSLKARSPDKYRQFAVCVRNEYRELVTHLIAPTTELEKLFYYKKTLLPEVYKIAAGSMGPFRNQKPNSVRKIYFEIKIGHTICLFDSFLEKHSELNKASHYTMLLLVCFYVSLKFTEDCSDLSEAKFLKNFPQMQGSLEQFKKCAYAFLDDCKWSLYRNEEEIKLKASQFRKHLIYDLLCFNKN